MDNAFYELLAVLMMGIFIGGMISLIYQFFMREKQEKALKKETDRILSKARSEAYRIEKKAEIKTKDWQIKMQRDFDRKIGDERKKINLERDKLHQNKTQLEMEHTRRMEDYKSKIERMDQEKQKLESKNVHLDSLQKQKENQLEKLNRQLENTAQMTQEEAQEILQKTLEEDLRSQLTVQLKEMENKIIEESHAKSKKILASALARHASSVTTEQTMESIPISGDDVKGKIIGREGRNIRALEHSCGVDIIIEEGQDAIAISCFDSVRRSVAKEAIVRLIKDGRIHPARIEEVVRKVKSEIFKSIKEQGEQACFDLGVHGAHPEIISALGGLKYKIIEGQNALKSSMDLAYLAGHIMAEIEGDEKKAKRVGLFHCLGLNVDHRIEGHYALVGAEFAKKYREPNDIVQAISCHNSKIQAQSLLDHIIQTAFNLHQSLLGVKKANIENFVSRMKNIESIANSFSGVIRSFAIQSGKEIRVLVDSSQVTDDQTTMLCADITRKIEREINPSYQLKVNVVRESRIIEYAR